MYKSLIKWFRTQLKRSTYCFEAINQVETPTVIEEKSPEKAIAHGKKTHLKLKSGYYYIYIAYELLFAECHNRITAIEPFLDNKRNTKIAGKHYLHCL